MGEWNESISRYGVVAILGFVGEESDIMDITESQWIEADLGEISLSS